MKKIYQIRLNKVINGKETFWVEDKLYETFDDAARELEKVENRYSHLVEMSGYDCSESRTEFETGEKLKWFRIENLSTDCSYEGWVETCEVVPPKKRYEVAVEYHTCVIQEVMASSEQEAKELFDESLIDFNNEVLNRCNTNVTLIPS